MTNIWGFSFPRKSTTRPSDLDGIVNGQVPAHLLRDVGIRSSKAHHLFNRGFQCLRWYCEQAGWVLDLASIDPRTYARQVAIFAGDRSSEGRYLPESMWAAHEAKGGRWATRDGGGHDIRSWEGKRWKRKAGTASAAIPGTSPHGDGLSTDIAIRRPDGSYPPIGVNEEFARWLVDSQIVLRCGMHWSLDSEPWHIQWTNYNVVPQFVKDWEAQIADPTDPTTPPPSDVDPPIPPNEPINENPSNQGDEEVTKILMFDDGTEIKQVGNTLAWQRDGFAAAMARKGEPFVLIDMENEAAALGRDYGADGLLHSMLQSCTTHSVAPYRVHDNGGLRLSWRKAGVSDAARLGDPRQPSTGDGVTGDF